MRRVRPVIVALSSIALGVTGTIVIIVSRRLPGKIEYYAPVKQEQQGSNPSS